MSTKLSLKIWLACVMTTKCSLNNVGLLDSSKSPHHCYFVNIVIPGMEGCSLTLRYLIQAEPVVSES